MPEQKQKDKWEYYLDVAYYDMWAVRQIGDRDFNSQWLFHVVHEQEAKNLCELLNSKDPWD